MDYIMNNAKHKYTSNSITIGFENCEYITIPNKFIHTLNIIKPQINEQHININWNGQFTYYNQEKAATLFFVVIKINEEYKQFLEKQYSEMETADLKHPNKNNAKNNQKQFDLDQLVNNTIQQLKRDDISHCTINDNNESVDKQIIPLHWTGNDYQNEALSYFHGKNESNKNELDELLCIMTTSLPQNIINDLQDQINNIFNVSYDDEYKIIDKRISKHISFL